MIRLTPHCRIVRMRGVVRNNGALCWLVNAETMMRVEEPLGNSGRLGSRAVAQSRSRAVAQSRSRAV
ncbi:MAG: hypothetical protein WCH84_04935, partial [Verrucomicrobiota bacterium]